MLDVAETLDQESRTRWVRGRIIDQLVGSGTSVGANTREADETVNRADFIKSLGWVQKELGETRYWMEIIGERGWIAPKRLSSLLTEAEELAKIFSVIVVRSRRNRDRQ